MICFPNAKINLGLNIVSERTDGFHNIETIFYPIGLTDILEFNSVESSNTRLKTSGTELDIPEEENICYKAYHLLASEYQLPPLEIYLHKIIPSGAGLGGGSSDAAFLLKEINSYFKLNISIEKLEKIASTLGSDCAFFIQNKAVFASGKGEIFESISINLSDNFIYLIKPDVFIGTAEAYSGIEPGYPNVSLKSLIKNPLETWKNTIINDFEFSIFNKYPLLSIIKSALYKHGAIYTSMSGSGSSIYGIFKEKPGKIRGFENYYNWISKM